MSIANSEILLAFKAGRAFRRDGSNFIDPNPTKGAIYITYDGDLLHFIWKNRVTNDIEEDLILFPSDATFVKVPQCTTGRVCVLKFSSSDQRHFFWMQSASSDRDEEFIRNVSGLLQDPNYDVQWTIPITPVGPAASSSTSTQNRPSSSTARQGNAGSNFQATPEQLATLQSVLTSMRGRGAGQAAPAPDMSLTDILTPANLTPLFTSHPELIASLFPHLPPDLPVPPSAEALQRIVHSPQFRAAVANFDQALRTGLLGGLVRSLGLPEEAGTGIAPFLRAIQEQADRERQNSMDTD